MSGTSTQNPEWRVRCAATRKNGDPYKKWSIRGGSVCEMHGGSAPQVRAAAAERIERVPAPRSWTSCRRPSFACANSWPHRT